MIKHGEEKKIIYLDNAATTKTAPEVVEAMLPYFTEMYGNSVQCLQLFPEEQRSHYCRQREDCKDSWGKSGGESILPQAEASLITGHESNCRAYASKGNHIITSKIEHHAILHTCDWLEKHGFEITYVDVDEFGKIKLDELEKAIRPTTILISVMFANNEIGTIPADQRDR